jgi:hypothetical protein
MGCCDKKLPGMVRMAGNAVRAVGRVARAVVRGDKVRVSSEVAAERLRVCVDCDESTEVVGKSGAVYHRCTNKACGCWLDGKGYAKTMLATETCPLKKWGET